MALQPAGRRLDSVTIAHARASPAVLRTASGEASLHFHDIDRFAVVGLQAPMSHNPIDKRRPRLLSRTTRAES